MKFAVPILRLVGMALVISTAIGPAFAEVKPASAAQTNATPSDGKQFQELAGKAQAEKEIAGVLKTDCDLTRNQQTSEVMAECKSLEQMLNLPKDRAAALEAIGTSAVDQAVALFREREEKFLLGMTAAQRRQILARHFRMGIDSRQAPTQTSTWTDGLAHLLTSDERARLASASDTRKLKRQHAMGEIMVLLLDQKIALTSAQREKLQPIADRLVKDIPELYPPDNPGAYFGIRPDLFYAATAKVGDAELKPILDSAQLKRWHALPKSAQSSEMMSIGVIPADDSAADKNTEPEDVEKAVSAFFYAKAENERQRTLSTNTLRAEDIARVAGLDPQESDRLQAAARGATEQYLTTWKWFTEQQIRAQLQGLTPQNVRQRLDGLQDFFFQRNFGTFNQDNVWDDTVQAVLTAKQQDAWKKETDARDGYRSAAVASLVVSEFDRRTHLTDDQWNRLQPIVAASSPTTVPASRRSSPT